MNEEQSSSGRLFGAKDLIKKLVFIQAGLPLAMPLDRVQLPLPGQGQKTGRFHWPQGGHQRIQGATNHLIFWEANVFFHRNYQPARPGSSDPGHLRHQKPDLSILLEPGQQLFSITCFSFPYPTLRSVYHIELGTSTVISQMTEGEYQ